MECGKHLEHGVRAPYDVDPEPKHEHDRAVTPTAVDDLVKDHPLKHDHAELQSVSTIIVLRARFCIHVKTQKYYLMVTFTIDM